MPTASGPTSRNVHSMYTAPYQDISTTTGRMPKIAQTVLGQADWNVRLATGQQAFRHQQLEEAAAFQNLKQKSGCNQPTVNDREAIQQEG